jgi:hypothetical protein
MSRGRWAVCDTIGALALGWVTLSIDLTVAAEPDGNARSAALQAYAETSAERLLLLTPGQPLRLDLALELGGEPLGVVWRRRIEQLAVDMSHGESNSLPLADAVQVADLASGDFGLDHSRTQIRDELRRLAGQPAVNAGERISRAALVDYVARSFPAFNISAGSAPGVAAAPALFGLLDTDGDGRLSRAELAAAERRLAVRDFDDDELISERELIVDPTQQVAARGPGQGKPGAGQDRVVLLSKSVSPASIAAVIVRHYDRDGDDRLSLNSQPAEISLPAPVAARLDANGDGSLDASELEAMSSQPPAAVLWLSFGSAGPVRKRETTAGDSSGLRVRRKIDGGYKLHLGDVQIDVNRNNRDPRQNGRGDLRFSAFDADQNGYLDRMEAKASPLLASAFDGMDTDHDEKVMSGEFQIYVDGQNSAAATRLRLQVIDRGQDLFSVLDANGDGLLTPRELRAAPGLIDTEDQDADGFLGGSEIPVRWSLDLARGSALAAETAPVALRVRAPQLAAGEAGPDWFRNMDRNHDGDLTAREFLGTAADFATADADHDGLIDAQEAAQFPTPR